jgi:single-strand DNA-binding protein
MGRGLNKVMVIGNMGRDPEMRYTPSGKPVTSFSLASSRSWVTPSGERREETEWFNVVAWGGLAEICNQKLFKSQQVYIEGRLQTRTWEDDNGQRHFRTEVVASDMIILGPKEKNKLKSNSHHAESGYESDYLEGDGYSADYADDYGFNTRG